MLQVVPVFLWSRKCAKTAHGELFGTEGFFENPRASIQESLKGCCRCRWLQAETNAVAARAVTEKHTDTQTDTQSMRLAADVVLEKSRLMVPRSC